MKPSFADKHAADLIFQEDDKCESCMKVVKIRNGNKVYVSNVIVNGLLMGSSYVIVLNKEGDIIAKNFLYRTF